MMWIDEATRVVTEAMVRADLPAFAAILLGTAVAFGLWATTRRRKTDEG
jgi:hypothetical protein